MMSRYVIGFISTFSGIVIIAAITRVGYIVNDINNFYGSTMEDMKKFKIFADDAWAEMISVNGQNRPRRQVHGESDAVNGAKISSHGGCNCGEKENNCPPGPPGLRGSHGESGVDGGDGQPARNGNTDTLCGYTRDDIRFKCIPCPVGEPGSTGPSGPEGFSGASGMYGEYGKAVKDGVPGEMGCVRNAGQYGEPGTPGERGTPGRNGQRWRRNPGPPGECGLQGSAGDPGAKGEVGGTGADGEFEVEGFAGNFGEYGLDGNEGEPGEEELSGQDSAYCPCPSRTSPMMLY